MFEAFLMMRIENEESKYSYGKYRWRIIINLNNGMLTLENSAAICIHILYNDEHNTRIFSGENYGVRLYTKSKPLIYLFLYSFMLLPFMPQCKH